MSFNRMEVLLPVVQRTEDPGDIIIDTPDWVSSCIVLFTTTNLHSDTPSVVPQMNIWLPGTLAFDNVAMTASAIAAMAAVGTIGVVVGVAAAPETGALNAEAADMPVPVRWRISFVHADAKDISYGVSVHWSASGR